jgi:hypothetical protein
MTQYLPRGSGKSRAHKRAPGATITIGKHEITASQQGSKLQANKTQPGNNNLPRAD